jgi:hypothetical protein
MSKYAADAPSTAPETRRLARHRTRVTAALWTAAGCALALWPASPAPAADAGVTIQTESHATTSAAGGTARNTTSSTATSAASGPSTHVTINGRRRGAVFDGVGAADGGGAMGRLLIDYPPAQRSQVLNYLFGPGGADLQILKLEIGGDSGMVDGALPSIEHSKGQIDCESGYQWWLAEQAVARDPQLRLAALQWSVPGWVGSVWTQTDIDYVLSWLNCARSHGLHISYLGGWNEHGFRVAWYEHLRKALNAHGYGSVKIMAADTFSGSSTNPKKSVYDPARAWSVAKAAAANPAFRRALGVLAAHDTCGGPTRGYQCESTPAARRLGPPLWESELGSLHGPPAPGSVARSINNGYIQAGITGFVLWPLITAMPRGLQYSGRGMVAASEPQDGHYAVNSITWAVAQTTQFTQPGWRHVNGASGPLGNSGSYDSYVSPDRRDWSLVAENAGGAPRQRIGPRRITVHLAGGLREGTVRVWSTDLDSPRPRTWFVRRADIHPSGGTFSYMIQPGYVVSFTSTSGQAHLRYRVPAAGQMPLPYSATEDASDEAWGLATQEGAFIYRPCLGGLTGDCIEQLTDRLPVFWQPVKSPYPYAIIGSPGWASYTVSARVLFTSATGSAGLIARFSDQGADPARFDGYQFNLLGDGQWQLVRNNPSAAPVVLASGTVTGVKPGGWHTIALSVNGDHITPSVDGHAEPAIVSSAYSSGLAGIESNWATVQFTDLKIR